jgi:hypothetical protein
MTLDEFRRLTEAWGGDPARWPAAAREPAAALLAGSAAARALRAEAAALDALIAAAPAPAPSAALLAAVLAAPRKGGAAPRAGRPAWRLALAAGPWPRLAGLAAAVLLGFAIGSVGPFAPARPVAADEAVNLSDYVFGDALAGEAAP